MALARLALKNLQQRVCSNPSVNNSIADRTLAGVERQKWGDNEFAKRFLAAAAGDTSKAAEGNTGGGKEVAVTKSKRPRLSRLLPRWQRRRGSLWRDSDRDFSPALPEIFPSAFGNALMQATDNINRLFDSMNVNLTPFQLSGRVKEQDECYKIRFDMPGVDKGEVKITVDEGVLRIKGEHKEEDEEEGDDEYWSSRSYGYYDTSLMLPDDARADDIKAELKNGVLHITIPKTEKPKKDVKEVQVN